LNEPSSARVCLDASLALKLVLIEDGTDMALELWRGWLESGMGVVAPSLITWEVASAIRKAALRGGIPRSGVTDLYEEFQELPVELIPHVQLPSVAWECFVLAYDLRISPYDATYLATARLLDCDLWTADERLMRTVGDALPWVRSLAEMAQDAP
jgi:predicted nucleic acid-binding protein